MVLPLGLRPNPSTKAHSAPQTFYSWIWGHFSTEREREREMSRGLRGRKGKLGKESRNGGELAPKWWGGSALPEMRLYPWQCWLGAG